MKKLLLPFALVFVCSAASAQGISRMSGSLSRPDGLSGARIEITGASDAASLIRNADHVTTHTTIMTYGVSLFRDNSQSAGSNARAVANQFAGMFPDIAVEVSYESPYFKVSAGHFIDRTDAIALCGKVLATFPKAIVIQEEISVTKWIASTAQSSTQKDPQL